jgi:hypothetical protein
MRERVYEARVRSAQASANKNTKRVVDYDFKPGSLVLVRNKGIENELDRKTKEGYFGPMIVVRRNTGGAYVLAELDGSLSKLRFGAARVVPYKARSQVKINIEHLLSLSSDQLQDATREEPEQDEVVNFEPEDPEAPEL